MEKSIDLNSNPNDLYFMNDLVEDSKYINTFCNTFIIFKLFDDMLYLVYIDSFNSILSYNLITFQIINQIHNAHKTDISNYHIIKII